MYCSQCGREISNDSKFCNECGSSVIENNNAGFESNQPPAFDAVADIQKKLQEIDNRKRPAPKTDGIVKSAFASLKNVIREEATASGLKLFDDGFEEKKLADKKKLIEDYPIPTSPKALASFAEYINSEIEAKKKKPDALTPVWKEKLKQVHLFAKKELKSTEEFTKIQKYHKVNKHRERRTAFREFVVLLLLPILSALIASIVFQLPLLSFVSILAAGWEVFLLLYVYDLLDNMVASIKQHSAKQHNVPKWLRYVAWYLLIPFLSALITSIIYQSTAFIILSAIIFGVDALFILFFLCYIYDL